MINDSNEVTIVLENIARMLCKQKRKNPDAFNGTTPDMLPLWMDHVGDAWDIYTTFVEPLHQELFVARNYE